MTLRLLAQKMNTSLANAAAVWMHGTDARKFCKGLIAENYSDLLPAGWRELAEV
jgi:hypothetical protein